MRVIRLKIKEKRGKIFSSMPGYFSLQPSLRMSAHSSQVVPFWNVHIPYSLPSAFFLISVVPPIFPQLTDAGLAIPAEVGGTVFIDLMVSVGVVTGGACWVQTGNENNGDFAETQHEKNALRGCHDILGKGFVLDVLKNVPNDCFVKSLKIGVFS